MQELLDKLNPAQKEAVAHPGGPCLILAGAGSGKTRVLTHRVAWLIREAGVRPWQIVAVTFTNKAAAEMRERVETLLGGPEASDVFLGTFHHFCVRLLRREAGRIGRDPSFTIYDTPEQLSLVKKVLRERNLSESAYPPRRLLSRISSAKNRLESPEVMQARTQSTWGRITADVYSDYQETLRMANAFDFDDLLVKSVELLEGDPEALEKYQERTLHLLVDEYQDTNHAQYRLIKALAGKHRNLTVVGDEDQSIFSWRGADISNILDFERDFPDARVFRLEQNYRSTTRILSAALAVVSQNENRKGKELWTENPEGAPVRLYRAAEGQDEASWVVSRIGSLLREGSSLRDMAIMYRTHAQSRLFEEELLRAGIPYIVLGGVRFYQRREIKDLLAYLTLAVNPDDPAAFLRVLNVPARGIGKKTEETLERFALDAGVSLWSALERAVAGEIGLSSRATTALRGFQSVIEAVRKEAGAGARPDDLLETIVRLTQYFTAFDREAEEEKLARRENVEQLLTASGEAVERGESVQEFLAGVALQSDVDALRSEETLPLMSLHSAKGLEFDRVFLVGLEEGLLPHVNSIEDPGALEEERRLCYVGMTRARKELIVSSASTRRVRGQTRDQLPSRFLDEIPQDLIEETTSPLLASKAGWGGTSYWKDAPRRPAKKMPLAGDASLSLSREPVFAPGASREDALAALEKHFGEKGKRAAERAMQRMAAPQTPPKEPGEKAPSDAAPLRKKASFRRGDKVRHTKYGAGVVLSVEPARGDQKLTVRFSSQGVKKFLASHAPIRHLLG